MIKTIIIYLVGYESDAVNGGVSGFDWYPNKESGDKGYEKTLKDFEGTNETFYKGTLQVEVDSYYTGTEDERLKITERIDMFLQENDWENAFKEKSERAIAM